MSNAQETTIANADLWTRYFQNEWSRWFAPSESSAVAEGTAASVAGFLTLVAAGPIAWLYNANTPTPLRAVATPAVFTADEMESVEEAAA